MSLANFRGISRQKQLEMTSEGFCKSSILKKLRFLFKTPHSESSQSPAAPPQNNFGTVPNLASL